MTKNIVITIDNSLTGEVELFASQPMANGTGQTAPTFSQFATYTNGTVTLSGLQETPADNSWHYVLFVRPAEQGMCSTLGNHQARFFLPSSVAATVALPELIANHSAWRNTVTRKNWSTNPGFEISGKNELFAALATRYENTSTPYQGTKSLGARWALANTFRYVGQENQIPAGYTYFKARLRVRNVSGADYVRLRAAWRDSPTSGAYTTSAGNVAVATGGNWTLQTFEGVIPSTTQNLAIYAYPTTTPTAWATNDNTAVEIDALNISLGSSASDTPDPTYFDGNTPSNGGVSYAWQGIENSSTSIEKVI